MFEIFNDLLNECHVGGDTSLATCLAITYYTSQILYFAFLATERKLRQTLERLD